MGYDQLRPGTTIADRYELTKLLGEGGMGEVWKARHTRLDSPVAVKFVRYEGDDRSRFHDRFEREAQLAASVKHRNVVTIMDYGETPEGIAYMVMDYLDGEPFATYVRGAFPTQEVVHLVVMALRGLVAVHAAGIVHRDLKPDNIFLVRDASGVYPKLLDFGISRQTDHSQSKRSAVTTQQGVLLGTPAYMSPEQARGLKDIDHRTDVYSMGVLLYEALAGQLPFDAEHIGDLMVKVISATPTHLHLLCPDLPRALCDAVMKSIARDRDERYQTAEEMRVALLSAVGTGQSMTLSERPTPTPGAYTYDKSKGTLAEATATVVTQDSLASSSLLQTLDGTSVDIALSPAESAAQRRKWIVVGVFAGVIVAAIGLALVLSQDAPSDVVVSPLEIHEQPAAAARPTELEPPVTAPSTVEAAAVEALPVVAKEPLAAEPPDAGKTAETLTPSPAKMPTPTGVSSARQRPVRPVQVQTKSPAKTTKTKSGVLTELDY